MSKFKGTLMDPESPAYFLQVRSLSWLMAPAIIVSLLQVFQRFLGLESSVITYPLVLVMVGFGFVTWYRRREKKIPAKLGTIELDHAGIYIHPNGSESQFFDFSSVEDLKASNLDIHLQTFWDTLMDQFSTSKKIPTLSFAFHGQIYTYTFTIESIWMYDKLQEVLGCQKNMSFATS